MIEDHKDKEGFEHVCDQFRNFKVCLEVAKNLNHLENLRYSTHPQNCNKNYPPFSIYCVVVVNA
jgi:hypothetical protein